MASERGGSGWDRWMRCQASQRACLRLAIASLAATITVAAVQTFSGEARRDAVGWIWLDRRERAQRSAPTPVEA